VIIIIIIVVVAVVVVFKVMLCDIVTDGICDSIIYYYCLGEKKENTKYNNRRAPSHTIQYSKCIPYSTCTVLMQVHCRSENKRKI